MPAYILATKDVPPRSPFWRRFAIVAPIAAVLLLTALYGAWWAIAARFMESQLQAFRDNAPQMGLDAGWSTLAVTGFPFRLEAALTKPSVVNSAAGIAWRGDKLSFQMQPWSLSHYVLRTDGYHRVAMATDEGLMTLDGRAGQAMVSVLLDGTQRPQKVDSVLTDAGGSLSLNGGLVEVRSKMAEAHWRQDADRASAGGLLTFSLLMRARDVRITGLPLLLGPDIERVAVDAVLKGVPGTVFDGIPAPQILASWRASGQPLTLRSAEISSGGVEAHAKGAIRLDADNFPDGELTLSIKGYDKLLEALFSGGMIDKAQLGQMQMAMGFMAAVTGGRRVVVPLRLRNASIYLGPVKIGPAPQLVL